MSTTIIVNDPSAGRVTGKLLRPSRTFAPYASASDINSAPRHVLLACIDPRYQSTSQSRKGLFASVRGVPPAVGRQSVGPPPGKSSASSAENNGELPASVDYVMPSVGYGWQQAAWPNARALLMQQLGVDLRLDSAFQTLSATPQVMLEDPTMSTSTSHMRPVPIGRMSYHALARHGRE